MWTCGDAAKRRHLLLILNAVLIRVIKPDDLQLGLAFVDPTTLFVSRISFSSTLNVSKHSELRLSAPAAIRPAFIFLASVIKSRMLVVHVSL
jgi:hypothetical protein